MARTRVVSGVFFAKLELEKFAGKKKKAPKVPKAPKKKPANGWVRETTKEEVEEYIKLRTWEGARPKHFVELYVKLHTEVYGVEPLELQVKAVAMRAASFAKRCLKDHFEMDVDAFAEFMRWVWIQQTWQSKKNAVAGKEPFRVTWKYQWSGGLVTQYRRALLLEKKERK